MLVSCERKLLHQKLWGTQLRNKANIENNVSLYYKFFRQQFWKPKLWFMKVHKLFRVLFRVLVSYRVYERLVSIKSVQHSLFCVFLFEATPRERLI